MLPSYGDGPVTHLRTGRVDKAMRDPARSASGLRPVHEPCPSVDLSWRRSSSRRRGGVTERV